MRIFPGTKASKARVALAGFVAVITSLAFPMGQCALAQDYPSRPVRLIVPNSPGSTHDLMSRIVGTEMAKFISQPIVVENKPGAGQILGYEFVAKQAPADGYTMTTVAIPTMALAPATVKELRFDILADLTPVTGLVETRYILVSPAQAPWKSFKEMVAYAKANPGKLNYGSSAQSIRIMTEVLSQELGLSMVRIDYNGGGPILQAITTGELHMAFLAESAINSGGDRMQVLASTGEKRRAPIANVPTLGELGFPQLGGLTYTLSVRSGTPKPAIDKLNEVARRALQQTEAKARLFAAQLEVWPQTGEAASKILRSQAQMYAQMADKLGIKPQ